MNLSIFYKRHLSWYNYLGDQMKKIYYYTSFEQDLVKSKNQDITLKDNFKWIHKNIFYKLLSYLLYYIFLIFSFIYTKLILRVSIKNKHLLKHKKNYYLYGNHTQAMGDAFIPTILTIPHRPFIIVNKANLGIPILGHILPMLGAIVIPEKLHDFKFFKEALSFYGSKHPLIIYPEAHVWPYYTKIRPFKATSFSLAIDNNAEVYSMTTTYQKTKHRKRPKIVIYIDGPFAVDKSLSKKEQAKFLRNKVYETMTERSKLSNTEYIKYIEVKKEN